jgi:hypothetical protein
MEKITLVEVDIHLTHTQDFGGASKVATCLLYTSDAADD